MTIRPVTSAAAHVRGWPVWQARRALQIDMAVTDAIGIVFIALAVWQAAWSLPDAAKAALLVALSVVFEEASRRIGQLRIKLAGALRLDMTSVWVLSAVLVLPTAYAIGVTAAICYYRWERQERPAGDAAFRKYFMFSTIVIELTAIGWILHAISGGEATADSGASAAVLVLVAAAALTTINRLQVTIALVCMGAPRRQMIGGLEENVLEIATLCLGGLVALALWHSAPLAALVLIPMGLLQRAALVRQLEVAATTDVKTGLLNAVVWEQLATREIARAERDHAATSIMIIDLDHFKSVNDVFGHLAGDAVLKEVGQILRAELRGYDTVGRFGGEEFVAAMPNTGEALAALVAERVRERISRLRMSELVVVADDTEDRVLTVSIGVACAPQHGNEVAELLHAADAALYRAKNGGRNRVVMAGDDTPGDRATVTA